ncbi:MAG TPA: immune inhibitor A [Anaerolineaceae bacterium]|nr:immune inhibitor A [Anaerolineaceae bacterium]
MNKTLKVLLIVLSLCVVVACGLTFAGLVHLGTLLETHPEVFSDTPTLSTQQTDTPTALPTQPLEPEEIDNIQANLEALLTEVVPINDPIDLAERLGGKENVPSTLPDPEAPYQVGAEKTFWVTNTDNNENFQVQATLRYLGDNIYFWIENGVRYQEPDLRQLADAFDQEIVPTNREFFGMEWNPGVDDDPRFYVLYARGLGSSLAGYFSSADELHPAAHPYSNAHEMFLLNADTVRLSENYIYGTMAHEFQHMIHWYQDRNEETWVNEGFSMLAEHVNDLNSGGFDFDYVINPDLQLTDWGAETGENGPHYGASYLFMVYFLDRFGEEATKALVAHPENGFSGLESVMQELGILNPTTGQVYTANEVFTDWVVTNYLQDPTVEQSRYTYRSYSPYDVSVSDSISECPDQITSDVSQFGVDYIEIDCPGTHTLSFRGGAVANILPFEAPPSGDYFLWSNLGDESDMYLMQTFDLTEVNGEAVLSFKTWYDLEEDYDYVFISASTDGKHWQILDSLTCTTENPSGNSYGCGWNGSSGDWIEERVDLSAFAGTEVTLRFDYVTDAAVNGIGMALDDFRLDAIGYASDLEQDAGGWEGAGFVRLMNALPQTYSLSVISEGNQTSVENISLEADNSTTFAVTIGGDVEKIVLVVSGTTPFTREKAPYQVEVR